MTIIINLGEDEKIASITIVPSDEEEAEERAEDQETEVWSAFSVILYLLKMLASIIGIILIYNWIIGFHTKTSEF